MIWIELGTYPAAGAVWPVVPAGLPARLPRAKPVPRPVPNVKGTSADTWGVSTGASEGVPADVDVSDMSMVVLWLTRAHRRERELRGCGLPAALNAPVSGQQAAKLVAKAVRGNC